MFNTKDPHFATSYFFKAQAISATAQTSEAFKLGETLGGVRIHGWVDGSISCASGDTITVTLLGADTADAETWTTIGTNVVTADSTTISGDLYSFIPDAAPKYVKVTVQGSGTMSGNFSVAPELVPH